MTGGAYAYAWFSACQQSHPFDDRRVPVGDEPVKIGRSMVKLRPTNDNAIFDCKVLSRNHAVLSYENKKFFLKDTRSSNGTFVNSQRLSKGSEESAPKQIFSGDIIQFGVDIIENQKKVTHGCIIAMVRLFHPDEQEATPQSYTDRKPLRPPPSPTTSSTSPLLSALSSQELYQLHQYIKEASHREQVIEAKLVALQALIASTQDVSSNRLQACIDEDRLLSRIEMLENQLIACSKNITDDKLRTQMQQLHEEKLRYETTAKEALRRALQEKMEAIQRLTDVERSLETTEDECVKLSEECESSHKELQSLAAQHSDALTRLQTLTTQLEEAEMLYIELERRFATEKSELETKLAEMTRHESILTAKIETLQADHDFSKEQLAAMKVRLEQLQTPPSHNGESQPDEIFLDGITSVLKRNEQQLLNVVGRSDERVQELTEQLKSTQIEVESCRQQLQASSNDLDESKKRVFKLHDELQKAHLEVANSSTRAAKLEGMLEIAEKRFDAIIDDAVGDMISGFDAAIVQKNRNDDLVKFLQEQVAQMENRLRGARSNKKLERRHSMENGLPQGDYSSQNGNHIDEQTDRFVNGDARSHRQKSLDAGIDNYKQQLFDSELLREQLETANKNLTKQLELYESRYGDANQEIERLQKLLMMDRHNGSNMKEDVLLLKLRSENDSHSDDHFAEAELLQERIAALTEDLEYERSMRKTSELDDDNARVALHRQAAKNQAEFAGLKEECSNLRKRISAIEAEIKMSKKENLRLSSEYQKLQDSYNALLQQKACLENDENSWRYQLDTARYDADLLRNQLNEAREELMLLRREKLDEQMSVADHNATDDEKAADVDHLEAQARLVAACSSIPLLLLVLAILMAFLPFFTSITATSDLSEENMDGT